MTDITKPKYNNGFTLLEMAVVLTIIALIAGGGLTIAARNAENEKTKLTQSACSLLLILSNNM